jgi:hypothetical protein
VIGLLCDEHGEPVATEVFRGNPIDHCYENLRTGMRDLFTALGVAA